MLIRFRSFWFTLRSSLWFVPTLMLAAAVGLSFLTIFFDRAVQRSWLEEFESIYSGGPEGARAVLAAIAGSMIGVTGVVFSITIVTLTLASAQFGPRLLRNFMRDLGNQVVLGTFIATFVYCLLVLRVVRERLDHGLGNIQGYSVTTLMHGGPTAYMGSMRGERVCATPFFLCYCC